MGAEGHLNNPLIVAAALLALAPYLCAGFFSARVTGCARRLLTALQIAAPALLCLPYILVSVAAGNFSAGWLCLYIALPVVVAGLLCWAGESGRRAAFTRLLILAVLGLAVDLRWFERAWPPHLSIFNKVLLLDLGIYAFVALRPIEGAGFDLRLRMRDLATGMREFALYLPVALSLGLGLGFLHLHSFGAHPARVLARFAAAWIFTFFFIAVPEELFFRGWLQNLLQRGMPRNAALLATAMLFGLAHFNKRAAHFNWRYVLLAALAGIFYGRAWRRDRRVGASAITHATVDAVWSLWLH